MFKIGDKVKVPDPMQEPGTGIWVEATIESLPQPPYLLNYSYSINLPLIGLFIGIATDYELSVWNAQQPIENFCVHEWHKYVGFTDVYNYCAKCDAKG